MHTKATTPEQDPFAMRRAGKLVAFWAETLPRMDGLPEGTAPGAPQKADQVHFTLKPKPLDNIVIGASSYYSTRRMYEEAHRALYLAQVDHVKEAAQALGLEVTVVASLQSKQGVRRRGEGDVALQVNLPQGSEAQALETLFAAMPAQQMAACVKHYTQMPTVGEGVFSTEMLLNPYDTSQLINKELATRVLAIRSRNHINEREQIEQFASQHGITNAVNALARGGSRELGV